MAKEVKHTLTVSGVTYRLVRDPDSESGSVHYWLEKKGTDRAGAPKWEATHSDPMKTTASSTTSIPTGVHQAVMAAFLESLTGSR